MIFFRFNISHDIVVETKVISRKMFYSKNLNKPRPEVLQVPEHGPKNKEPHGHVTYAQGNKSLKFLSSR